MVWSKKKRERMAKELAMARLLNRELIVVVERGKDYRGDLIDWDNETITIQYKISDEPIFQLKTFIRKFCSFRLANPSQQILNNPKTIPTKENELKSFLPS